MSRAPRLGFLGVGWIGRHRMAALLKAGAQAVALADPSAENMAEALRLAPDARPVADLDALLDERIDGLVIATPSALHAEQAIQALDRGLSVFCQKPLGRDAREVEAVLAAARRADRCLGVDLSYRFTEGMQAIRRLIDAGELGQVFAADLTFHNAYGPDKPWFYAPVLSGGGCLMDLGVHLIDLALWTLRYPPVRSVSGHLMHAGMPIADRTRVVEDYALAEIVLEQGAVIRIACSWHLPAGRDAVIGAEFFGTAGGAAMRNVGGSFLDFTAERFRGTSAERLSSPPDDWGGRAAFHWLRKLALPRYDAEADRLADVARLMDRIYADAAPVSQAARSAA
ncbi:Gfo/Idh/MocA family protein [Rhizorhabdus argentea]|uniref:Gfo/Idh/MocA family protein n=1 Tax=Rhizorhabdus argentea TaxID=1387174 RepID=UPI0030EF0F69